MGSGVERPGKPHLSYVTAYPQTVIASHSLACSPNHKGVDFLSGGFERTQGVRMSMQMPPDEGASAPNAGVDQFHKTYDGCAAGNASIWWPGSMASSVPPTNDGRSG